MATFAELKDLSQHMDRITGKNAIGTIELDEEGEHISRDARYANDFFVKRNPTVPGVMDYHASGFTEPEDERDCMANNMALARLDELMPYLEKANQGLSSEQLSDPNYSLHALHLGAEILEAKDRSFSEESIDYLCGKPFQRDFPYFGSKHYEYEMTDARWSLEGGVSLDGVKAIQDTNPDNRQSVHFYMDRCKQYGHDCDWDAVRLIGNAHDMGEAFAMYNHIADGNITVEQGRRIHDAIGRIVEAIPGEYNVPISMSYDDGSTYKLDRFSRMSMESQVDSMVELVQSDPFISEHPSVLVPLTDMFIEKGGQERWISEFYEANPEMMNEAYAKDRSLTVDRDLGIQFASSEEEEYELSE